MRRVQKRRRKLFKDLKVFLIERKAYENLKLAVFLASFSLYLLVSIILTQTSPNERHNKRISIKMKKLSSHSVRLFPHNYFTSSFSVCSSSHPFNNGSKLTAATGYTQKQKETHFFSSM